MNDVTRILSSIEQGDAQAAEQLLPLVYQELRTLAAQRLAQEDPGQTLQATALVRRILIDNARRKHRSKRGGDHVRIDLDAIDVAAPEASDDLLALDDALTLLAEQDAQAAELVKLRYFAGLTIKQAAEILGISPRSADFLWVFARAWLLKKIQGPDATSSAG